MKCSHCNKNNALYDREYGYVFCQPCQDKPTHLKRSVEFTTASIKDQRMEFDKDTRQAFFGNTLSKEFLEEYGTVGISPTKGQLKNAKYTNKGTPGWWNRNKSKGGRK